jgi:caffeoyl-CoA O-methyltransferase
MDEWTLARKAAVGSRVCRRGASAKRQPTSNPTANGAHMNKPFGNDEPALAAYVHKVYAPEDEVLREIRERSRQAGLPDIQLAALDARHLEVLARAGSARCAVEIGTLGGYSGVAILRGLTPDGVLDTVERDAKHAAVARESFRKAGLARRARVHVGPAAEILPRLVRRGPFDLCFIDADKEGYPAYVRWAAANLRRGGLVVLDNAFLFGQLPRRPAGESAAAIAAMRATHELLARGGEFRATVLPTGEGLAVGVKL